MICAPCAEGGQKLTSYRRLLTELGPDDYITTKVRARIEALHTKCKGGTWCDCVHSLDVSLNSQARKSEIEVKAVVE